MPSAAKQRIPADLWHSRYGRHSPGHCIQASPGLLETYSDDFKHHSNLTAKKAPNAQQKSQKKQRSTFVGVTLNALHGCSEDLSLVNIPVKDTSKSVNQVSSDLSVSQPIKSSNSSKCNSSTAFAMDAALPPHPSELPLPPMEWLKPTSQSPLTIGKTLQMILAC